MEGEEDEGDAEQEEQRFASVRQKGLHGEGTFQQGCGSVRAICGDYRTPGTGEDVDVKPDGPILNDVFIKSCAFGEGKMISARDLPKAGNAGADLLV